MDEKTTDILERARLRREMLLKRAQEEGIESSKFFENALPINASGTDRVNTKSKVRRSNSFSDLSQKSVKDRLLSWKVMERQQIEKKMQPSNSRGQVCGSLTNLSPTISQGTSLDIKMASTEQKQNEIQIDSLKLELTNQQSKKIFPSYLASNASNNVENKENIQSQRKHYLEPKFGPLTASRLASPSSSTTNKTTEPVTPKTPGIKKLGPATLGIQDKLSKLCQESWKRNQIAEDIQKKKEDDMKLLASRWNNGFLCNESDNKMTSSDIYQQDDVIKESFKPETDENGIPLPPPLPLPGEIKNWKNCASPDLPKAVEAKLCINSSNSGQPRAFHPKNCISVVQDTRSPKEVPSKSLLKGRNKNINFADDVRSPTIVKHSIAHASSTAVSNKKTITDIKKSHDRNVDLPNSTGGSKLLTGNIHNKVQPKLELQKFNRFPQPFSKHHLEKKYSPGKVESPVAESDSITSVDSFAENIANDFKKNLTAMGYHVEKSKGKEAVVELETESEDHSIKMGESGLAPRSREVTANAPRVKSHFEERAMNCSRGNNDFNKSINARPISVVERKQVITNFNKHDIITMSKKRLVKIDADATKSDSSDLSETQAEKNFQNKTHEQGKILNKKKNSEMNTLDTGCFSAKNNRSNEPAGETAVSDDDDDTYGLEDDDVSQGTKSSCEKESVPTNNKMETYFSTTDMQAGHKKHDFDDFYVQMNGKNCQKWNSSSDEISEGCYPATEEDSDLYEEIVDSSPAKANCRRHVSMRRAFKSHFSDEDASDSLSSDAAYSGEDALLLRRKVENNVRGMRPFTTTNASFDPPVHSSPLPHPNRSHKLANDFKRSSHNVVLGNGHSRGKITRATGHGAKKRGSQKFKSEEFLAPAGTLARLAASSNLKQQYVVKNHLNQLLERRGFFFHPLSQDRKMVDHEGLAHNPNNVSSHPAIPAKSAKVKIQSLEELIEQEEKFSIQASNALNICVKKSHLWTDEAVECHRILLTAAKRKEILLHQLKRLREGRHAIGSGLSSGTPVVGKLIITGVRFPLKPEFIAKSGTIIDTTVTYFVMTVQSGESVCSSQTVSTKDPIVLGSLEVPGQLVLAGIPMEFSALLEVYALIVPRDMKSSSSKKALAVKKVAESASKRFSHRTDSEDEQNFTSGLGSSYFIPVGRLELNERLVNKGHFPLEGITYPGPLQGSVHIKVKYLPETSVHCRAYLNVCPEGSREFSRKWCCLTQSEINIWRNASDELIKEPLMQIDLMSCITEQLVPVGIDYRLQKDAFEVTTISKSEPIAGRMKERMSEKNSMPTKLQQIRCWFSADSADECASWCNLINRNLRELRTWHPYAIPPVGFKQPQVSPFTFDSLL